MIAKLVVEQNKENRSLEVKKILEEKNIKTGHPDLFLIDSLDKLGIEQARDIKEFLSIKPFTLDTKIVIINNADRLTVDAQNSLLKILEEPPDFGEIFLLASTENTFLPTLISRCHVDNRHLQPKDPVHAGKLYSFVEASTEEKFEIIEKVEDREQFLEDLVIFFAERLRKDPISNNLEVLRQLQNAEKWAKSNGNTRAILEYIALVIGKQ